MDHVDEEKYEISVDVHGMRDGPRLGRLRVLNMVNLWAWKYYHISMNLIQKIFHYLLLAWNYKNPLFL